MTKVTNNFAGSVVKTINYGYDEMSRRTYTERDGDASNGPDGLWQAERWLLP